MLAKEDMVILLRFRKLFASQEASYLIEPVDRASTPTLDELLIVHLPAPVTPVE